MVTLGALVPAIVVAAIAVFVLSSILHMALKYHQADYRQLPDEQAVAGLRGVPPGLYVFPYCANAKDMGTPEMQAKLGAGPVGMAILRPAGPTAMGKLLGLWFVYLLLVSLFVGYVASITLAVGAIPLAVFRLTATVAFMSYGLASMVGSIWMGQPWSNTVRAMIDGMLYALATGGVFAALSP